MLCSWHIHYTIDNTCVKCAICIWHNIRLAQKAYAVFLNYCPETLQKVGYANGNDNMKSIFLWVPKQNCRFIGWLKSEKMQNSISSTRWSWSDQIWSDYLVTAWWMPSKRDKKCNEKTEFRCRKDAYQYQRSTHAPISVQNSGSVLIVS